MQIVATILPIFVIILLGWVARKKGLITPPFLNQANTLVFYFSIPALVFSSIAKGSFHEQFSLLIIAVSLLSAALTYGIAHLVVRILNLPAKRAGAFVLSSGHGNLGYVGLPIALYYLGEAGLVQASVICAFLMILQNVLSIATLQYLGPTQTRTVSLLAIGKRLLQNPVILGALAGMAVSALGIPIPFVVQKSFDILGGLAPPMALMLIGASMSVKTMRAHYRSTMGAAILKLIVLPGISLAMFALLDIGPQRFLPSLVLLCSPTATVVYVMSKELDSDEQFAVATISASTLLSLLSYLFWLSLVAGAHPSIS